MSEMVKTKKKIFDNLLLLGGLGLLFFALVSCQNEGQILEKESLFFLEIGKMEKELDFMLFPNSTRFVRDNYVNLNGLFYISNSRSNKVLVLTAYGDLISLFYDPNLNPEPITLSYTEIENTASNLNAYSHNFTNIGLITVDSKKRLMVDEEVERGRVEKNLNSGVILNRTIRCFGADGKFLHDLGQEGIGGTPFSFIDSLYITKEDQLTVVCRNENDWEVFAYDSMGELVYEFLFDESKLPGVVKDRIVGLENIYVDYQNSRLFFKINYYDRSFEGESSSGRGISFFETSVWVFDIDEGQFTSHFDLPHKFFYDENYRSSREVLYEFVGIDKRANLFFIASEEKDLFEVLIVNSFGKVLDQIRVSIGDESSHAEQFYVSPEGILSALLVYIDKVEVVRWRTDLVVRRIKY